MSDGHNQSESISLWQILQRHEEQLIDFEKNICLLCKRKTSDVDKHRNLSKLHSSRLKRLRQRLFSDEQLDRIERKERESQYRDRAKERRLQYGQTDRMIPLEPINPVLRQDMSKPKLGSATIDSVPKRLGLDNKGAALMSKMGWRQGSGLGKNNEGMTDLIKLESQVGTSGLGSKSYKVDSNLSYKDAVKQIMYRRYHEITELEEERNDKK